MRGFFDKTPAYFPNAVVGAIYRIMVAGMLTFASGRALTYKQSQ